MLDCPNGPSLEKEKNNQDLYIVLIGETEELFKEGMGRDTYTSTIVANSALGKVQCNLT